MKAKGFADLLTATTVKTLYEETDILKIAPRSDGKALIIRLNELAEPILNYISEIKAFSAITHCIEEGIVSTDKSADALFVSPVRYQLEYNKEFDFTPLAPQSLNYLIILHRETLIQFRLTNVHIDQGLYDRFESVMIKCIHLKYIELDNNTMDEPLSERIIKVISEWALDKIKTLKIKNNRLNTNCCRTLTYYLNLRMGGGAAAGSILLNKTYGYFQTLVLSNCALEDSFISEFCDNLQHYSQEIFLNCDFSNNPLSDRGLQILANAIATKRAISHLNISEWKSLSNIAFEHFLDSIMNNNTLVEIDFRENPLRRRVYEKVLTYLKVNNVIQRISMDLDMDGIELSEINRFSKYMGRYRFTLFE